MKFVCYSDWDKLPDSASELFKQAEKESVFFSPHWFESVSVAERNDDLPVTLACVVKEDEVLAILPLVDNANKTWYSLKHKYTPLYSLLLADGDQQHILDCLAHGLSQLPMNGLILEPLAEDDKNLQGLKQAMVTVGFSCEPYFRHYNWIYHTRGQSFDEYMGSRPSKLRNTILRKQRKLERDYGYKIRLFTDDDVMQAMPDYYTVYSASWKSNEQLVEFVNSVVEGFSRKGWAHLAILYVKEQPVAAQLWFVYHGKASIFRLAYDEAWKKYSTGSILTQYLMEYVINTDKVEEIDFLTGNDAYKQDWMSERRERYALCFVRRKPVGRFGNWLNSFKQGLRR